VRLRLVGLFCLLFRLFPLLLQPFPFLTQSVTVRLFRFAYDLWARILVIQIDAARSQYLKASVKRRNLP
jgi:hypothetical protein